MGQPRKKRRGRPRQKVDLRMLAVRNEAGLFEIALGGLIAMRVLSVRSTDAIGSIKQVAGSTATELDTWDIESGGRDIETDDGRLQAWETWIWEEGNGLELKRSTRLLVRSSNYATVIVRAELMDDE